MGKKWHVITRFIQDGTQKGRAHCWIYDDIAWGDVKEEVKQSEQEQKDCHIYVEHFDEESEALRYVTAVYQENRGYKYEV